jgi:hypothetical protein
VADSLKYNLHTLQKIEALFNASDYIIRYERGNFNSGYCILENKKVVVVNKFYDTEARINCLIDIIGDVLILEDNLEEKQLKFYNSLLSVKVDKKEE